MGTGRHRRASKAYSFDGVNDYIQLPSGVSSSLIHDVTVSLWMKPSSVGNKFLFLRKDSGNDESVKLGITNGSVEFKINNTPLLTGSTLTEGNWLHVVAMMVRPKNLTERARAANALKSGILPSSNYPSYIGVDKDSNFNQHFHGSIDDVRIYDPCPRRRYPTCTPWSSNPRIHLLRFKSWRVASLQYPAMVRMLFSKDGRFPLGNGS